MARVTYRRVAAKARMKLPEATQGRIRAAIAEYAATARGDVKKLSGSGLVRLRMGDYRVIFDRTEQGLDILVIAHRREVYR